eukprot:13010998-Alexandrium_andersonii.AAC.1
MASSSSSWQPRAPLWQSVQPPVQASPPEAPGPDGEQLMWEDDDDFYNNCTPQEAGFELASLLMDLKRQGTLSAKQGCLIAFWATRAGAAGDVSRLAFRPNAPSGHFSRHWDAATGSKITKQNWYFLPTPLSSRCDATRVEVDVSVLPPHELLVSECQRSSHRGLLATALEQNRLPPAYTEHP